MVRSIVHPALSRALRIAGMHRTIFRRLRRVCTWLEASLGLEVWCSGLIVIICSQDHESTIHPCVIETNQSDKFVQDNFVYGAESHSYTVENIFCLNNL